MLTMASSLRIMLLMKIAYSSLTDRFLSRKRVKLSPGFGVGFG